MRNLNIAHHPKALWFLSLNQTFYAFSFGSITSLLILYLIQTLELPAHRSYEIFAAMSSLIYILPLLGGYIGEKVGYILTILVGFTIVFLGLVFLSIHEKQLMYLGIACFAAGNAFVVPNINALVGLQYSDNSVLRNSGYTLYFLIYNVGFLVSPIIAGFISLENANAAFFIAACSILIASGIFIYGIRTIKTEDLIMKQGLYWVFQKIVFLLISAGIIVYLTLFLIQQQSINDKFLACMAFLVICGLTLLAKKQNRSGRLKMLAFLVLCILSIAFWSLYMLAPSLLTVFIKNNINRDVFGLGLILPPSCYYALDAFFVIVLGFFFSWLWHYCAEKNRDISLPAKFAFSLLAVAIAFLILVLAIAFANHESHLINSIWIVLAYVFIAIGELLLSPIALAMVGLLMPKGQEGFGMGIWQAFIGFSAVISGFLANLIKIPKDSVPVVTNVLYMHAFLKMGLITLVIGSIILVLSPKIKKVLSI